MHSFDDDTYAFTCKTCNNQMHAAKLQFTDTSRGDDELLAASVYRPGTATSHARFTDAFTLIYSNDDDHYNYCDNDWCEAQLDARLSDLLTSTYDVDAPVCDQCVNKLCELMDKELSLASEDHETYTRLLHEQRHSRLAGDDVSSERAELAELGEEEQRLLAQISVAQSSLAELDEQLSAARAEEREIDEAGERLCQEYQLTRRQKQQTQHEVEALRVRIGHADKQLVQLRSSNAFRVAFTRAKSGEFVSINGFRLGYQEDVIDWAETNTALGQCAFLLETLARRIGMRFERYRIVPNGAYSYIANTKDNLELPLYSSGSFKVPHEAKIDTGLMAFLDCITQFEQELKRRYSNFTLPCPINKSKLSSNNESYSIRINFNTEENWSKALQLMLTNLNWCLAYVSKKFGSRSDDSADED